MADQPDAVKPWHRQPNETDHEWKLFQYFLTADASERRTQKVADAFQMKYDSVKKIRAKRDWNDRIRAYDSFLSTESDKVAIASAREAGFNWVDWETQNHEKVRSIAERLLKKCEQMLALPVQEMRQETNPVIDPTTGEAMTDHRGRPIYQTVTIVQPVRFSASDAPRYAEAAVILTRYLAENYGPQPINNPLPPPSKPIEDMSIEEREEYIAQIRIRQQELTAGANEIGGVQ